jgi:hypothetical protein
MCVYMRGKRESRPLGGGLGPSEASNGDGMGGDGGKVGCAEKDRERADLVRVDIGTQRY